MSPNRADSDNAKTLARMCAVVILAMLYTLGGISLYLRAHYLKPTVTPSAVTAAPQATWTPLPPVTTAVPTATPTLTPTLFPTLTPKAPSGPGQ